MAASPSSPVDRHRALGLTDAEYQLILARLAREPNDVELAMLSLMWSEHCAYKHSRKLLRLLPTEGADVLLGPGENAGVVDLGGGLSLAFKVESHNHPSAVEPFQGAATGVGGILRDVFAVGARPIAILDSLRFGEPATSPRSRYLLERTVAGIGHYGNSIGVPTIGGEIYFEPSYEQNCLVNAMCLGLAPRERLIRSAAAGPGNVLVLLGALTGRDGIGGASVLASAELGDADEAKRPSVQIGDPFAEKKLLECCLDLLDRRLLVCLQDLGAAGLTSSAAEMASKGEVGLELDVARVPVREAGLEAFEVMISESQERMLCVVAPERMDEVLQVCERWDTLATPIGGVIGDQRLRVLDDGRLEADLPVAILVDDCPLYDLNPVQPGGGVDSRDGAAESGQEAAGFGVVESGEETAGFGVASGEDAAGFGVANSGEDAAACPAGQAAYSEGAPLYPPPDAVLGGDETPEEILLALLASPNIASRRPVFEQYDCIVQSRTIRRPQDADAAVLALPDGGALAVSIDGNGRRAAVDPRLGAVEAVCECAANLACVGAQPLGLTNCLNFGNPEKPHVAWQLTEAVHGLAQACQALELPVVGGNVSLYNEAPSGPILPTPVVGIVGRLPDVRRAGRIGFAREGDAIALVGSFAPSPAGSELAKLRGRTPGGELPPVDMPAVRAAHREVRDAVRSGALHSAHDIAEGGIAVAVAECCAAGGIGAQVAAPMEIELFDEAPGRAFIVSGAAHALAGMRIIGRVGGPDLEIEGRLKLAVSALRGAHEHGLEELL